MENQYLDQPLDVNLNIYKSVLEKYIPQIEQFKIPEKLEHQYKHLANKLFPIYGRKIYTLAYKTWYTDGKLIIAHKQTEKYCKDKIPENRFKYLVSCMRKMPY